ncbi:MAG TPA: choice-of-anchor N protein [Candidatus Krumholzibacterium sp.]|nr:choice-of-anchor N protein [Candidatus Krumholzibacterium sp.]
MMKMKVLALTLALAVLLGGSALAVPRLQTYIVDSDYYGYFQHVEEDVWVTTARDFDLKVVGYWGAAGDDASKLGTDVNNLYKSSIAYDQIETWIVVSVPTGQSGTVWINGVEIDGFYNYGDPGLTATAPSWYTKTMLPSLKNYGFYRAGTIDNANANAWHYDHGIIHEPGWGDEILMDVVVSGFEWTHFDAIGVDSYGRTYVAPNSHDSSFFSTPEPGTLSLLGLGLLGVVPVLRRKK